MDTATRPRLVRLYVGLLILAATGGFVASFVHDANIPSGTPGAVWGVVAFGVLGLLLQLAEHRLAVGSVAGSIAFIVYLGATLLFGRTWGAAITGGSLGMAQVLARRPALRVGFNVAQHLLAILAAATVYESLGGRFPPPSSLDESFVPFAAMVVTFFTLNSTAVSAVVALSEGQRFNEIWLRNTWGWVGYDLIASALSLGVVWMYMRLGITGMAIVLIPIVFLRHTYLVNVQLQSTNRELLELMVKAIEARDPYTSGHSQRVSQLARLLASEMGLHLGDVDNIATAALLHDVGKIYEEFAPILRKEGKLTPEERQTMQSHPARSAELVGTISTLRGYVEKCVRHHHENFDGSGYPDGLAGNEIPVGSRIVLVADTTDAMTTDRPYRKALNYERVVEELGKYARKQFDPRVVAAFKKSSAVRRLVQEARPSAEARPAPAAARPVQLAAR